MKIKRNKKQRKIVRKKTTENPTTSEKIQKTHREEEDVLSNGESQSIVELLASQIHPQAAGGICAVGAWLPDGELPWPSASRRRMFSQLHSCT